MLKQLIHNGIIIPEPPAPRGLVIRVRGRERRLTPKEEEMAMAFAAKKDTDYVQDAVFVSNFMADLSAEMGIDPPLSRDEIDLSPLHRLVDEERARKEALTKEERKALAAERKAVREELKARYGYAIANGQRVELGTYMTEPSGIFMGRGQHPLRGRWKEGASYEDVTLNLSPDAPRPEGDWEEIVWQPESMWVARWKDKLSGKLKYIWLSDTAPIKQQREENKFDKAIRLDAELHRVRERIEQDLHDERPARRRIATACYLIDALTLRVGDEKDPDEADTVGATTLRPEHITLHDDGQVEFQFLGKDSVEWHRTISLPDQVRANLAELTENARPSSGANDGEGRGLPQIFPDVSSRTVNAYLSSIVPGLSAKVFRTHHATMAVERSLKESRVKAKDPEYKKWQAASLANLEAVILCYHTKYATGNWTKTRQCYAERRDKARERLARYEDQVREQRNAVAALRREAKRREEEATTPERAKKVRARYNKRLATARRRLTTARDRQRRAKDAVAKIDAQKRIAGEKRVWNLGTSLKSYIDPRVYHRWGQKVEYDVLERYYPATLRRKFLWVRAADDGRRKAADDTITVRTAMTSDLSAVVALLAAIKEEHPELDLPFSQDEVAERYLPLLGGAWKEALIALDDERVIVGFASLGPEWSAEDGDYVDVVAYAHPLRETEALGTRLAENLNQCLATYAVQFPRKNLELRPQDETWLAAMPTLAEALGLAEEAYDDEPTAEDDEETEDTDDAEGLEEPPEDASTAGGAEHEVA